MGGMEEIAIDVEAPDTADVVALLEAHLAFANEHSPSEHVHALDLSGLKVPSITFCSARRGGQLLGVGALRDLGDGRFEVKSMHTSAAARGTGVGRRMLDHLVDLATERGGTWLGLETGTMAAFEPARQLYETAGFEPCAPFGDYTDNPFSVCYSRTL